MAYEPVPKPYEDRDLLVELYWNQTLTLAEVAEHFDVEREMIRTTMIRFDIPRRPCNQRVRDWTNVSLDDYQAELESHEEVEAPAPAWTSYKGTA